MRATMLSDARVSLPFFVFFGARDGDEEAATVWNLHERAWVRSLRRVPEDCWRVPSERVGRHVARR